MAAVAGRPAAGGPPALMMVTATIMTQLAAAALLLALPVAHAGCTVGPAPPACVADFKIPCPSCPPPYHRLRVLGEPIVPRPKALTLEFCAQLCFDRKLPRAGVEGVDCICGHVVDPRAEPLSGPVACATPCSGDHAEHCGGNYQLLVYNFSCSGPPVPQPRPAPPAPRPPPGPPKPKPSPPPYAPPPPCQFNKPGCSELVNPCLNHSNYSALPFCNMSLPHEKRVQYLISRMTTDEKIAMLGNRGKGIAALGVPSYNWWSEASTGVANWIERRGQSTQTTKFAFPITTAMAFNRSLWTFTGRQIGREARAMMNAGTAYSSFWAPVINLAREPRWGRNIETPGEDPYLTGEYSIAFTKGMQNSPDDTEHLQASACCKHYIGNTMESTKQKDGEMENRESVDSNITMRDLVDSYMVPFQQCVEKGKVSGLMCSYNSVNGAPSCANTWLLDTVARKEWGFDGYVSAISLCLFLPAAVVHLVSLASNTNSGIVCRSRVIAPQRRACSAAIITRTTAPSKWLQTFSTLARTLGATSLASPLWCSTRLQHWGTVLSQWQILRLGWQCNSGFGCGSDTSISSRR